MKTHLIILGLCLVFTGAASATDTYFYFDGKGTNITLRSSTLEKGQKPVNSEAVKLTIAQRQALRELGEVPSLLLPGEPAFACIRTTNGVPANLNFRIGTKETRYILKPTASELAKAQAVLDSLNP